MQKLVSLVFLIIPIAALATDSYPKNDAIDVKHYSFRLEVNDSTNVITGQAAISILFNKETSDFELDLVNKNERAEGMEVIQIVFGENKLRFSHQHDRLKIFLTPSAKPHDQLTFIVYYKGIPRDGLIIGATKFVDRGFSEIIGRTAAIIGCRWWIIPAIRQALILLLSPPFIMPSSPVVLRQKKVGLTRSANSRTGTKRLKSLSK